MKVARTIAEVREAIAHRPVGLVPTMGFLHDGHTAKFVRRYASLGDEMRNAIGRYVDDIRTGRFPNDDSEAFHMSNAEELRSLYGSANVVEMPRQ